MRAAFLAGLVLAMVWSLSARPCLSAAAPAGLPPVTIAAEVRPDRIELRLAGTARPPVAVFHRGRELWIVVGGGPQEPAGWPRLARPDAGGWLTPIASETVAQARLLRFALQHPVKITVTAAADAWYISLGAVIATPEAAEANDPFERSVEHGTLAAMVRGELVQATDPATGERLGILLSTMAGLRHATGARLVDLELLPSVQGLVWRPLADGVTASIKDGRLTLSRPGGLRLSHGAAATSVAARSTPAGHQPGDAAPLPPIGLAALGTTDAASRQRARLDLMAGPRQLAGVPRAVARLELARLYLADALAPEARTVLELIDTATLADPAVSVLQLSRAAMSGAAAALAGQTDRALAVLLDHRLDQDPEVALWRAYAAALAPRWELAAQEWTRAGPLLDAYPEPLRRLLGLELAAAMVAQGDAGTALALVDRLRSMTLSADTRARLNLIQGSGLARMGQPIKADRALRAALEHGGRDVRTRSAFLLTSLRQERGELPASEAVAQLRTQQSGWRGHAWESRMLRRLAELQAAAGETIAALGSWEAARTRAPDPGTAAAAGNEQAARLRALLSATGDHAVPPVAALALYRTYGRMLGGADGDGEIRASLAARAAENGLLATAAALLDPPGAGTPPAPSHDEATLALAEARAAAGDGAGALARLAGPVAGKASPPPAQAALRAQLRAEAAYRAGAGRAAVAALAGVPGHAAARLRWAALREQRDWAELARSAAALLPADFGTSQLEPLAMEAATWLALARHELGQPDAAATLAQGLESRTGAGPPGALLRLAAQTGPRVVTASDLPAAIGLYGGDVRRALDQLTTAAAASGTALLRSAGGHSSPAG